MKTWIVSDTHFGHENCYKFTDMRTGELIRPWAKTASEADAIMMAKWNDHIAPNDKVYHLGDVAIPRSGLKCMEKLHGKKVLIRGNHDIFRMADYAEYFYDIRGTHKIDNLILSHYPIHHESIPVWCINNIHGHTHTNMVRLEDDSLDHRYTNVCIEHTNQAPVELDQLRDEIKTLLT